MAENNTANNASFQFMYSLTPLTIICSFGVVSNVLLLVAFIKDPLKCFRNSGTYLVMSLSVSDCLACLVSPFYYSTKKKILKTASDLIKFLAFWLGGASFLSITSISVDRFLMVAYPIKHRIFMKGKLIILWLTAIWIASLMVAGLSLTYIVKKGSNMAQIVAAIVITLSAVMYSSTYYKLKKQTRILAALNSTESRAQEIRTLKEKRFLTTIILIACLAFSCVTPYMIVYITYDLLSLRKDTLTFEVMETATTIIFSTNFAMNPLIYILRLPSYRKTFYLLYCRKRTVSR